MNQRRRASIGLLGVTLLWGGTFVWMKLALNAATGEIDEYGTTAVVGIMVSFRFLLAALSLLLISSRARAALFSKEDWLGGAILGTLMLFGYGIQMVGLESVTPSVSAFLTSLYVVFTAIIGSKFAKHKLSRTMIMGALLATLGAGFIDGLPHIVWGWGEILTIVCAIFFALHILATDNITKRLDPIKISMTSFTFVGIGAGVIGLLSAGEVSVASVITTKGVFNQLLLLGFFGTLVCLLLLNIYQKQFHPTHAAIIYAFEPLWATIYALGLDLIEMSYWLLIGGSAVLLGNIIVEIDSHHRREEEE